MLKYDEIPIFAADGLHEDCFNLVREIYPHKATIFDVAAGAGAFSKRLLDAGYNVVANDINDATWALSSLKKRSMDLNMPLDYSSLGISYDMVVAMEVIEHLESPLKLLIDCKKLIKADGYILLSTPNLMDMYSRFMFLRKGMFYHFSPQSYHATGHQAILPYWLLELFFERVGLDVVQRKFGGKHLLNVQNVKSLFALILMNLFKPFMKYVNKDELRSNYIIYVLRNKK